MRNIKVQSSKAFSLIEMIGVLAIIGILASVVAPKVFDAIRDAKITAAAGVNNAIKSATVDFARKYRILPIDGKRAPAGTTPTRTYGDGKSPITATECTFGDILISEGMLEKLSVPIGPSGTNALTSTTVTVGVAAGKPTLDVGDLDYPAVICFNFVSTTDEEKLFTASANSIRVAALVIPGLTTLEAAGLKTKIDGPFNESVKSAYEVCTAAVTKTSTSSAIREAITRGNCLLFYGDATNAAAGYNALLYVAHE
jgi:prepilin-type N-terminal cleavage/methylation domain-containing protein